MITEVEVRDIIHNNFSSCLQSLAKISEGESSKTLKPLADYPDRFHNYDLIAKKLFKRTPKSPDMVLFNEAAIFFVEFKSGKIKPDEIKLKAIEGGFLILQKIIEPHKNDVNFIDICRLKKSYIVVYDKDKNARERLYDQERSNIVRFGLGIYKGSFFHDVKTFSNVQFKTWLQDNHFIETA